MVTPATPAGGVVLVVIVAVVPEPKSGARGEGVVVELGFVPWGVPLAKLMKQLDVLGLDGPVAVVVRVLNRLSLEGVVPAPVVVSLLWTCKPSGDGALVRPEAPAAAPEEGPNREVMPVLTCDSFMTTPAMCPSGDSERRR